MSDQEWIIVPNWERFQHYGLVKMPAWIKLYTSLNSHDAWNDLTFAERGLLVTIWIEYARSKRRLTVHNLPRNVTQKVHKRSLEALNHAGFIRFSSRPEVDKEEEEELQGTTETNRAYPDVSQSPSRASARAYHPFIHVERELPGKRVLPDDVRRWLADRPAS